MLSLMKNCYLKTFCNSALIEQKILYNLLATRTTCNKCESLSFTGTGKHFKNEICSKHLSVLLNCSHTSAINVMADCPEIITQNPISIKESASILLQHCDMTSILKNPEVFLLKPVRIRERVHILQEIGVITITADKVSRFGALMKQSMKILKKDGIVSSTSKVVDNMLEALDCPKEVASTLKTKMQLKNIGFSTAKNIRIRIMQHYLCWKLQCHPSTMGRIAKIYPSIFSHSCHTIKQTLEILIGSYHFTESKICSNGFLLSLYPANLELMLHSVPILAGMDMRDCAVRVPRILCMSPEQLLETEKLVKKNNYTNEQLLKCLSVYNLKPITVQQRLETIEKEEELAIRKVVPHVLYAVASHKLVLSRLKQFQENELMNISLYKLLKNEDITEFEKISSTYLPCLTEICYYLASVLNKTKDEVRNKIVRHPSMKQGSLSNAKKVTEYLLDNGVSKEQLWHGVYIVLYSINDVKKQFIKLPTYEDLHPFDEWKTHHNFIHLLLYYIEKEFDFALESSAEKCETIVQNHLEASVND